MLQSTPLFKKIEEDYHSNMVVPELNAKKEILKLIRRMNRPIDPQEIKVSFIFEMGYRITRSNGHLTGEK